MYTNIAEDQRHKYDINGFKKRPMSERLDEMWVYKQVDKSWHFHVNAMVRFMSAIGSANRDNDYQGHQAVDWLLDFVQFVWIRCTWLDDPSALKHMRKCVCSIGAGYIFTQLRYIGCGQVDTIPVNPNCIPQAIMSRLGNGGKKKVEYVARIAWDVPRVSRGPPRCEEDSETGFFGKVNSYFMTMRPVSFMKGFHVFTAVLVVGKASDAFMAMTLPLLPRRTANLMATRRHRLSLTKLFKRHQAAIPFFMQNKREFIMSIRIGFRHWILLRGLDLSGWAGAASGVDGRCFFAVKHKPISEAKLNVRVKMVETEALTVWNRMHNPKKCGWCKEEEDALSLHVFKACRNCLSEWYCSRRCQKKSWKTQHRDQCASKKKMSKR